MNSYVRQSGIVSGGSRLWTPEDDPNVVLRLQGQDATTITEVANKVSAWADKSGFGNDATESTLKPTTNVQTIDGKNAIDFNNPVDERLNVAHDSSLNFDALNGYGVFLMTNLHGYTNQGGTTNQILSKGSTSQGLTIWLGSTNNIGFISGAGDQLVHSSINNHGSDILLTCYYNRDTETTKIRINGGSQETKTSSTGLSNNALALIISAQNDPVRYCDQHIAELIIVKGAVDGEPRKLIEGFLAWEYGTESLLPSDHKYKNAPPRI